MDREWLVVRLLPACAVLLGACAGDIGNDRTMESAGGAHEQESEPDEFQTLQDHIIPGFGSETGETGETGDKPAIDDGTGTSSSGIPLHGDPPLLLSDGGGPYWVDSYEISTGRVYYPRDAPAPYAGLALCGGFLNTGWEFTSWGEFYASWGIVTVITWTSAVDTPSVRGWALSAAIKELRDENSNPLSPIAGKMSDRYGTSGYSMGGGGTTVSAGDDSSLKVSIGMAAWAPGGLGVQVPTLFMCGTTDIIASCSQSDLAYAAMSESVPKMSAMVSGGHLSWFDPSAGWGAGGGLALAFAKVFLEGDTRWKSALLADDHIYQTNIY